MSGALSPWIAVAGLVVGFAVGATGVGGGSLMTPALIMLFGVNPVTAVGTDLMYATISKVFGVVLHGRNRSVDWRIVGWQALGSIPATLATLEFLRDDDYRAQIARLTTLVLAVAVLATAIIILFPQRRLSRADPDRPSAADRGVAGRPALTALGGALIGVLVTISSVGAGVIGMVMLMWLYPRVATIRLIGTDMTHSVLITAIAGLGHAELGTIDYEVLIALLIGGFPGIWLGSKLGFRMNATILRRSVAATLLIAGATTLTKALRH